MKSYVIKYGNKSRLYLEIYRNAQKNTIVYSHVTVYSRVGKITQKKSCIIIFYYFILFHIGG